MFAALTSPFALSCYSLRDKDPVPKPMNTESAASALSPAPAPAGEPLRWADHAAAIWVPGTVPGAVLDTRLPSVHRIRSNSLSDRQDSQSSDSEGQPEALEHAAGLTPATPAPARPGGGASQPEADGLSPQHQAMEDRPDSGRCLRCRQAAQSVRHCGHATFLCCAKVVCGG